MSAPSSPIATAGGPAAPDFVELQPPVTLARPGTAPEPTCELEMTNARGATLRLRLQGRALVGLPALCLAFCNA